MYVGIRAARKTHELLFKLNKNLPTQKINEYNIYLYNIIQYIPVHNFCNDAGGGPKWTAPRMQYSLGIRYRVPTEPQLNHNQLRLERPLES